MSTLLYSITISTFRASRPENVFNKKTFCSTDFKELNKHIIDHEKAIRFSNEFDACGQAQNLVYSVYSDITVSEILEKHAIPKSHVLKFIQSELG